VLILSAPWKGGGLQRVEASPGNWFAPPSSNRSSSGGKEAAEASGVEGRYERTSSIKPVEVLATACRQWGPYATREVPAVIAVWINWQLARDRPGRLGWRRGSQYR
jgi:hypothetical protein